MSGDLKCAAEVVTAAPASFAGSCSLLIRMKYEMIAVYDSVNNVQRNAHASMRRRGLRSARPPYFMPESSRMIPLFRPSGDDEPRNMRATVWGEHRFIIKLLWL